MTDILLQAKKLLELRENMKPENKPSLLDVAKLGDFMNEHPEHPFEFAKALVEAVDILSRMEMYEDFSEPIHGNEFGVCPTCQCGYEDPNGINAVRSNARDFLARIGVSEDGSRKETAT